MKIAVVTDDGKMISQHFGRARYYIVYDVQGGVVMGSEMRQKAAHHVECESHREGEGPHGHHDNAKHDSMLSNISDCEALIARGMGWDALEAIRSVGIKPFITDLELAKETAKAYIAGKLDSHTERLH